MVGGLGVEDQTNGLRYVPKFIPCGVVGLNQRRSLPIKTQNT